VARVLAPPDAAGFPRVRRDLVTAALALALLGALVFGPQVIHGGFYWDDWQNAANVQFTGHPGLFGALDQATERPVFGYRPVLTALLAIQYEILGTHKSLLLALALLYSVSTAWALFLLLRTLGVRAREAIVPAALLLVFPWCDSTRMWNTASFDTLAVTLFLLGLTLAVKALREQRRGLHAASLTLYLAAAWTYEIVAIAVLAAGAVYMLVAPRREALRRSAFDALVVAGALALVAAGTTRTPLSLADQVAHAGTIAQQSFSVLARALVPVGAVPGIVGALLLVLALAIGRRFVAAGLGALAVVAGYVLFIPAARYYEPLAPGTTNRMNVLAAVGFVVLVWALVRQAFPRRVAAVVLAAIAVGYVVQVRDDQHGWERSAREQERVLAAIPRPPRGTTVYTFNAPSFAAPGVPVFSLPFDLRSAVRLQFDDPSLKAYPVRGLVVIECDAAGLHPVGGTYGPVHGAAYGEAWFVSVPRRRVFRVDSRRQCEALRARLGA
jgi:hypothetical protein